MFITTIVEDASVPKGPHKIDIETTYECSEYSLRSIGETAELMILDKMIVLQKENTELYIANNDGDTINSYKWRQRYKDAEPLTIDDDRA